MVGDDQGPNNLPVTEDETEDEREAVRPPSVDAEIVEPSERFAKHVTEQLVAGMSSWTGRLPPPDSLEQFDTVVPGLARELADDMLEEGKRFDRAATMDHEISTRVVTMMEKESESDITFRDHVFDWLLPLFYLPLIVIIVIIFAPIDDWVKAVIIPSILLASVAPVCISLLRGRMTKNEVDAIKSTLPHIAAAASATTSTSGPEPPSGQKVLSGDETRQLSDPTENSHP